MPKLIVTKGLPRSGKTTWSKQLVESSGNYVRVNRDDLREMLHCNKWTPKNEKVTMSVQKSIVETALKKGKSVIVDDTNLGQYHTERWLNVARENGATFEVKKFDSSDIGQLIFRDDWDETSSRGDHVIIRLALEHDYITFENDSIVVCDLDGTLCDIEHRRHYVRKEKKDWDSFFREIPEDKIREDVDKMLQGYLDRGKKIIFVSARPERCRRDTTKWLREHNYALKYRIDDEGYYPYEALIMRPDGDTRNDAIVKQEILDNYLDKDSIHTVIDDRPVVVRMWRENGLEVIDVGDGTEF